MRNCKNRKRKRRLRKFILAAAAVILLTVSVNAVSDFAGMLADSIPGRSAVNTDMTDEDDNSWKFVLINREHPVPDDWVTDLVKLKNGQFADSRVMPELQQMMDDARNEGLNPYICSGYRTFEKQQSLYESRIRSYEEQGYSYDEAVDMTEEWVAYPGTSEHESGLAFDIVSDSMQELDSDQADTDVQQWLMKNSWRYGFILRYPEDKKDITGIGYEPWHYRYVGKEAAEEIFRKGICLEEYLE